MAKTMSAGAGDGDRPAPREFAEELRAISDGDHPDPLLSAAAEQLKHRAPAGAARDSAGDPSPVQARPPHRVIPARRPQAPVEDSADTHPPVEPRPIRRATEPADKEEEMAKASDAAAAAAARWQPTDADNEFIKVLCFLEERSFPEIVEAVIRDYIESRAQDDDVRAVLDARGHYRKV